MRIQLINVPYKEAYGSLKDIAAVYFPLGLGYLASVLKKNELTQIDLFDPEAERSNWGDIKKRIKKFSPDIIGLSFVTATYPTAKKTAKIIKKINPAIFVVAGGIHVSALPKEVLLDCPEIDLLVLGEGEYTFLEICQNFGTIDGWQNIPGVAFRKGKKIIFTSPRNFISDLDGIPFPARDLVNMDNYFAPSHMNIGRKSVTLISSRGCPAQCTFCASWVVAGRKFRAHSPDYVLKEIEYLQGNFGFDHFIFEDDSFTIDKERVKEICRRLMKRKKKIVWSCFGRVTTVDKSLLTTMKKAGCYLIGYGVESGNEEILKKIKKGITKKQCLEAFRLSQEVGLKTQGFFMIGNPGETEKTIKETINFAIELDPTLAFFSPLVPYPGTEIYCHSSGISFDPSKEWSNYSAFGDHLALNPRHISAKKIKYYCSLANRRFYLRPAYLIKRIVDISSLAELKASLLGGFALITKSFKWFSQN